VIGVALLLFATVASLIALTAGIGAVVDGGAATATADRVAGGLDRLDPAETTGRDSERLPLGDGQLGLAARDVRVIPAGEVGDASPTVTARVRANALVYRTADGDGDGRGRRVAAVAGAVVRGEPGAGATVVNEPRVAVGPDTVVVGVPVWTAGTGPGGTLAAGGGEGAVTVRVDVTHSRQSFARGRYALAVETATPEPWARLLADRGASVTRADYDGDGVVSVVASFGGPREWVLVRHGTSVEVGG
jgi:hypothetical protein